MGAIPTNTEIELRDIDIIVSKGDGVGNITYANPIFYKIAGYTQYELIDQPHSIIRHPDMPRVIFKLLWDNLKEGKDLYAFVKNLTKEGNFYWVFAYVRVANNPDGSFRNYLSTRKAMSESARAVIEPLYTKLIQSEEIGGMDASIKILEEFLQTKDASLVTFNDTMTSIQNS